MWNFRNLEVWQHSHRLAVEISGAAERFGDRHKYGLAGQIKPAAASVPANIAEGASRQSVPDSRRFLTIAIRSASEVENRLLLTRDRRLLSDDAVESYLSENSGIMRMLSPLRRRVK